MGSVADYHTINFRLFCKPYGYVNHRATVSVYKNSHNNSPDFSYYNCYNHIVPENNSTGVSLNSGAPILFISNKEEFLQ